MTAQPTPKGAWKITFLLFLFMLVNFADKIVVGLAGAPIMDELNLQPEQFGLLGSSFFFLFSISAIVVGFIVNRVATRWVLLVMAVVWSLAITTVWWTLGFNFVLYLAGLQDIPRELYDAAAVDGARQWRQMWRITIPLLGRTTTLVAVLQAIASLKVFDQIYLLLSGGPNDATRPAIEYIYDVGFTGYRVGYASAVSVVFFLIILAISVVWFRIIRRQEREA